MPDLYHLLRNQDQGFIQIIADLWGIEHPVGNSQNALQTVISTMNDPSALKEVLEILGKDAQNAMDFIIQAGGKVPWLVFERRFGEVREMGAGRRDRERPDLNPTSVAERLWYYGLLGRSFFDEKPSPQEFAYIPDEVFNVLNSQSSKSALLPGRPIEKETIPYKIFSTDRILDDICTLLAALRKRQPFSYHLSISEPAYSIFIQSILRQGGVLGDNGLPIPENTRRLLESARGETLGRVAEMWLSSPDINDLENLTSLEFEGPLQNDPLATRKAVIQMINLLPQGSWWDLNSFVQYIKNKQPDFMRMAGDYDAWFVKEKHTGEYLSGFANWENVEGRLIHYYLTGPLHWLAMIDLASSSENAPIISFRLSNRWKQLLNNEIPAGVEQEKESTFVKSNATIIIPMLAPRSIRYLIARYCDWAGENGSNYIYRISDKSLSEASSQGLAARKLILLLKKHSVNPLPPNLLAALERWDKVGSQAQLKKPTVMTFSNKKLLDDVLKSGASRYFGERLNPVSIILKPGNENKIMDALLDFGVIVKVEKSNQV